MRAERKGAVNGACKRGSVAAAARTAASARAAATGRFDDGQGLVGFDGETEIADVDGDAADLLEQVLGNDESEAVSDLAVVVIRGFVEGEAETGAVASAGGEIDADRRLFLVGEKCGQFIDCVLGKSDHGKLQAAGKPCGQGSPIAVGMPKRLAKRTGALFYDVQGKSLSADRLQPHWDVKADA